MNTLDASSVLGLFSLGCLTANFLVGGAIRLKKKLPLLRGISLLWIHKLTGYSAALCILIHVLLIPLDSASGFRWADLILPLWTPHQRLVNTLGALALYLTALVVITSYFRKNMSYKIWRRSHYLSYAAAPAFLIHGLLTDPQLKDRPVDWWDGEKVFVEICALVFIALVAFRLRRRRKNTTLNT